MSGIGIAMLAGVSSGGGGPPPPDPGPLSVSAQWIGFNPTNVAGASGEVPHGSGAFFGSFSGGTAPYTYGFTVIANPSGKLGITPDGSDPTFAYVSYGGFALNEQESIAVNFSVTDGLGASGSYSTAATIKRTS